MDDMKVYDKLIDVCKELNKEGLNRYHTSTDHFEIQIVRKGWDKQQKVNSGRQT